MPAICSLIEFDCAHFNVGTQRLRASDIAVEMDSSVPLRPQFTVIGWTSNVHSRASSGSRQRERIDYYYCYEAERRVDCRVDAAPAFERERESEKESERGVAMCGICDAQLAHARNEYLENCRLCERVRTLPL